MKQSVRILAPQSTVSSPQLPKQQSVRILAPQLTVSSPQSTPRKHSMVIVSFESCDNIAAIYNSLRRGEKIKMAGFRLSPFGAEEAGLLLSEFPLRLNHQPEGFWFLSAEV